MTNNNLFKITDSAKLKTSEIVAELRKHFPVYIYDEEKVDKNFPKPKKSTTRYFGANVEADEELANKSADDLERGEIEGITLRERLLMELQYFKKTRNHLDIENITLCSGSRVANGFVPNVCWDDSRVSVLWCGQDSAYGRLRGRSVVSKSKSLKLDTLPEELTINGIKYRRKN